MLEYYSAGLRKKLKGNLYKYPEDFTVREVHSEGICQVEKLAETVESIKDTLITEV
ncbi:MAG TPA: hypothetical protein HA230_01595 [Candidatus Aenigmarchaeota archaeon]|nr:hypothetical protein [Candidatus Aenigmarchaeota archaeon]